MGGSKIAVVERVVWIEPNGFSKVPFRLFLQALRMVHKSSRIPCLSIGWRQDDGLGNRRQRPIELALMVLSLALGQEGGGGILIAGRDC